MTSVSGSRCRVRPSVPLSICCVRKCINVYTTVRSILIPVSCFVAPLFTSFLHSCCPSPLAILVESSSSLSHAPFSCFSFLSLSLFTFYLSTLDLLHHSPIHAPFSASLSFLLSKVNNKLSFDFILCPNKDSKACPLACVT